MLYETPKKSRRIMPTFLNALRGLVLSILTNEPTLVVGAIVAGVVAALGLVGIVAPLGAVITVVTVIVGALVTRLQVTPVK
jgi:hypothetical protein